MALAMSTPMLMANNAPALRVMPRGLMPVQARGNCDLMASNTVTAQFVGLRELAVQRIDQNEPERVQVGVFQVLDNLAYRRYNRIGDGQLTPGMQFTIAMNKQLPGQPSENVDTIASLQAGEEVAMRVDHLYLITGQEGESIRVCARIARRNAAAPAAAPTPAATPAPLPIPGAQPSIASHSGGLQITSSSSSFSMHTDANGQMQTVQTSRYYDSATGEIKTRMLINGVEVDPVTKQPLAPVSPDSDVTPPAKVDPAPAPVSETQAEQEAAADQDDDTIVEHNNNPIIQPGDDDPLTTPNQAPVPSPAPIPSPAASQMNATDSF